MSDILDELQWRGLVSQTTDADALRQALADGPVTFYCGFDPTAPSLHIGSLVQLLAMRHLQRAGHRPLCLVGGSTGLIGDPKATSERTLNDPGTVRDWVERIQQQVRPFLDFEGDNPATMVNNLDWTAPMSALELLRDIGQHFRVNAMIKKDAVAARLASDAGISYTEFSYQVLQGLDYLHLFRRHGCTLQTGGADQWGNLTAGSDLIHRAERTSVHLLTTPLITKADGTKFGKTESGTVWLHPGLTSPYAFYQFWLNVEDASVVNHLKVFTDRTREQVAELEQEVTERPFARVAQRTLAEDVTTLVHGAATAAAVRKASAALFGRDRLEDLDEPTLRDALAALNQAPVHLADTVVDALVGCGLASGRAAARRTIAEGGAYLNNVKVVDPEAVLGPDQLLHGRYAVLRRGRKSLAAAVLPDAATGGI